MAQSLSQLQIASLIGAGTFLWGVGVVKIRYAGPFCYATNRGRLATFMATVPLSYVMSRTAEAIFAATPEEKGPVVTILAGTTLLLDGIGFTWLSHLYENEDVKQKDPNLAARMSRTGAAWLLYGTGLCLLMGALTK